MDLDSFVMEPFVVIVERGLGLKKASFSDLLLLVKVVLIMLIDEQYIG